MERQRRVEVATVAEIVAAAGAAATLKAHRKEITDDQGIPQFLSGGKIKGKIAPPTPIVL